MVAAVSGSLASPAADAAYKTVTGAVDGGLLSRIYNGTNGMSVVIAVILILVAYDQCEHTHNDGRWENYADRS